MINFIIYCLVYMQILIKIVLSSDRQVAYMDGSNAQELYVKKYCNSAQSPQFSKYEYGFFDFDSLSTTPPTTTTDAISIGYFPFNLSTIPYFEREVNIDTIFLRPNFGKNIDYQIDDISVLQMPFTGSSSALSYPCSTDDQSLAGYTSISQFYRGRFYQNISSNAQMVLRVSEEYEDKKYPKLLLISSIQVNVNSCHPSCATCSGPNQNQCLTCSQSGPDQNNQCSCTNSAYFFQNGSCVASCDQTNGYFQKDPTQKVCYFVNKQCTKWNSQTQRCGACVITYMPQNDLCVQQQCSTGYESVLDASSNTKTCLFKDRNKIGQVILSGLYSNEFSSFEIKSLGLTSTGFKQVNQQSSFYSRCDKYQLFGGYFINKKGSTISYSYTSSTSYSYLKINFKYFLIDYQYLSDDTGITITVNGSSQNIKVPQSSVGSSINICGLDKVDVVGEFSQEFGPQIMPSSSSLVTITITNNNAQSDDSSSNQVSYFGIREISVNLYNCIDFCSQCSDFNSCTSCINGYFINSSQVCQQCDSTCSSCTNITSCITCKDPNASNTREQTLCQCPPSQYFDLTSFACTKCANTNCSTCSQTNSKQCLTCSGIYGLLNGNCVASCGSKMYNDQNVCKPCISNCLSCTDNTTCNQCSVGFFLLNTCLQTCPAGYFQNTTLNKCDLCTDTSCQICQKAANQCTQCNGLFVSTSFTCVSQCQSNEYESNSICKTCNSLISNCLKCSLTTCTACATGFYLTQDGLSCVAVCPNGQVGVDSTGSCTSCSDTNCIQCDKNDLTVCNTCKTGIYFENNKCVTACSPINYGDQYYNCIPCNKKFTQCLNCNATQCTLCDSNSAYKYLHINLQSCLQNCQQVQYYSTLLGRCDTCKNTKCNTCQESDSNLCITCSSSFAQQYLLYNQQCYDQCPTGSYPKDKYNCDSCTTYDPNCSACTDTMCVQCSIGFLLDPTSSKCSNTCPAQTVNNYLCMANPSCPTNCVTCSADGTQCTVCASGFYLSNFQCGTSCPSGTYPNSMKNECTLCSSFLGQNCSQCTVNDCLATNCPDNQAYEIHLKIQANQCVNTCYNNLYPNPARICKWCGNSNCKTCDPKAPPNCLTCFSSAENLNYLFQANNCVSICSKGYYQSSTNCLPCETGCSNCTADKCVLCTDPKQYINPISKQCVNICPDGYYQGINSENNNECLQCSSSFSGCQLCDPTQCTLCQQSTQVFDPVNKICADNCPDKYYLSSGKCLACTNTKCKQCNQTNSSICLSCDPKSIYLFFTEDGDCVQTCSSLEYPDTANSKCVKCSSKFKDPCISCNNQACSKCSSLQQQYYISVYDDFSCVNPCPPGQFGDPSTNNCSKCKNTRCDQCQITDSNLCVTCSKTGGYPMFLSKDCLSNCPNGYYPDQNDLCQVCTKYDVKCSLCTPSNCTACASSLYLQVDKNICLTTCSDHYYPTLVNNVLQCLLCSDPNCLQCDPTTPSVCKLCMSGYYFNQIQCVTKCNDDQFGDDISRQCMNCNVVYKNCVKCTKTQCLQCKTNYFLVEETQQCYIQCPYNYIDRALVDPSYDQQQFKKCTKCSNPNCETCNPKDLSQCLSCSQDSTISNYPYFYNQNCTQNCNQYLKKDNNYCYDQCPVEDSQTETPKQCLVCSKYVENRVCVDSCKSSTFIDPKNPTVCVDCEIHYSSNCSVCNIKQCLSCSNQNYLYQNKCYQICPVSSYNTENTMQCQSSCNSPSVVEGIVCKSECSSGYYPTKQNDQIICQKCSEQCKECIRTADTCTECFPGVGQDCFNEKSIEYNTKSIICKEIDQKDQDSCDEIITEQQQLANLFYYSSFVTLGLSIFVLFTNHSFASTYSLYYIQIFQLVANYILLESPKLLMLKELALRYCLSFNIFQALPLPFDAGKNRDKLTDFSLFDGIIHFTNLNKSSQKNNFYQLCALALMILIIFFNFRKKDKVKIAEYLRNNILNKLFMISSNLILLSSFYQVYHKEFFGTLDIVFVIGSLLLYAILFVLNTSSVINFQLQSSLQESIFEKNILTQDLLNDTPRRIFWILFELRKIVAVVIVIISPQGYSSIWVILPINLVFLIYCSVFRPFERTYQTICISLLEVGYTVLIINLPFINSLSSSQGFTYLGLGVQAISGLFILSLSLYYIVKFLRSCKFSFESLKQQKKIVKCQNDITELSVAYSMPNNTTQMNLNTLKKSFVTPAKKLE